MFIGTLFLQFLYITYSFNHQILKQKYIFNNVALKPDVYERVKKLEYSENPFRHNRKNVG